MKAMILAAGLGTRLRPWTLRHPKALVPVKGIPMLERVIEKLKEAGFDDICINIHHFGDQIIEYLKDHDLGIKWNISDEREKLLDTGGGLLQAGKILFSQDTAPFLVHNVDILSDANLAELMTYHNASGNDITLLASGRESSRKLVVDGNGALKGWHNIATGEYRPAGFVSSEEDKDVSFSGIYVVGRGAFEILKEYSVERGEDVFPVMDFLLENVNKLRIGTYYTPRLNLIDIGKPETLEKANVEGL